MARLKVYEEWVSYVPTFSGNRESPEPFTIMIKPLSTEETGRYGRSLRTWQIPGSRRGETADNADQVTRKMFLENVGEIRGMEVEDATGKVTQIKTAEDLWNARGFQPLVSELQAAITDVSVLSEGEAANLGLPPGGPSKD